MLKYSLFLYISENNYKFLQILTGTYTSGFDSFSYTKSGFSVSTALVIAAIMDNRRTLVTMSL